MYSSKTDFNRPQQGSAHTKLHLALCLLAGMPMLALADLNAKLPPGGNFALDHWNITVPADDSGTGVGKATTVAPQDLNGTDGYHSAWFYTDSDGAMTFWTPVNGAVQGGSDHPRSELRELLDPSTSAVNWDDRGTSILDAQVKVIKVPSDGKLIIGQVHGYNAAPLVLVYYQYDPATQSGKIIGKLQGTPVQGLPYYVHTLATGIKLGQAFTYQIKVYNNGSQGVAQASVNNGTPASMLMDASWDSQTFYFKAGSYLHTSGTSSDDGGLAKFYRLAASHPTQDMEIQGKAALPDATADLPYQTQLQASGGVGTFTWSLASGFPPAGINLDASGSLKGIPTACSASSSPHVFVVQAKDANGNTLAKKLSLLVTP